jgi:4-amino-4-deoxy-L-arabinose transferase-like glycosyltransferase
MDFVTAHRDGAKYLFATDSWRTASPYVLATGQPVLPMGGFTGAAPYPTLAQFQRLVATGQLRYVLVSSRGFSILAMLGGPSAATGTAQTATGTIVEWVKSRCTATEIDGLYACGS